VPDFPNLFCMLGPNTGPAHGGSVIFQSECQSRYITACLVAMIERGMVAPKIEFGMRQFLNIVQRYRQRFTPFPPDLQVEPGDYLLDWRRGQRALRYCHDVDDAGFAARGKPVEIDDYAVLFAGAMVMPGVHLGKGSVVMAGSVVTKSVAAMRIVGGNPAQDIGERKGELAYTLARRYWFAH